MQLSHLAATHTTDVDRATFLELSLSLSNSLDINNNNDDNDDDVVL